MVRIDFKSIVPHLSHMKKIVLPFPPGHPFSAQNGRISESSLDLLHVQCRDQYVRLIPFGLLVSVLHVVAFLAVGLLSVASL